MRKLLIILAVFILFSSCSTTVKRVESGTQQDLSGYWNARDVRIVCDSLIKECLSSRGVNQLLLAGGNKKPVVIVGRFRNESSEHIDTSIISTVMETAIFNSGKLDFVAGESLRQELSEERHYQSGGSVSDETAAKLGREIGADLMMNGTVKTIIDREGNKTIRTYFVSATLTNIETNARVWIGQNDEITKVIVRPRNRL